MGCMNKVFRGEIDVELFEQAERTRHGFGGVKMTGLAAAPVPRLGRARLRRLQRGLRLREPGLLRARRDRATSSTCATGCSALAGQRACAAGATRGLPRAERSGCEPGSRSREARLWRRLRAQAVPRSSSSRRRPSGRVAVEPGPSKRAGSSSKRGSDRKAAQPRAPSSPSPGDAWRSRFEPSGVFESFTCRQRRRRMPTVFSKSSTTSPSLSAVVMSKPLANMWQESRQTPSRLSPPARSISSRSSSKSGRACCRRRRCSRAAGGSPPTRRARA